MARFAGIPCWEAPLYHRNPDGGGTFQEFITPSGGEVDVRPTSGQEERKRQMCVAYSSQGDFLSRFGVEREIVRPQITYDYTQPPHAGKTNYEVWQWKMTAQEVSAAFAEFQRKAAHTTAR